MTKEERYQEVITRALSSIYQHLEQLMDSVPGDTLNEIDDAEIIGAIRAVESEWVLDEDARASISLLTDLDD